VRTYAWMVLLGRNGVVNRFLIQTGVITEPLVNKADNSTSFAYVLRPYTTGGPRSFAEARGLVINDYQAVNTATRAGDFIDPKSKLGLQFAELAGSLLNRPRVETGSKRKFLEFLSAPSQTLAGSRTVPSR